MTKTRIVLACGADEAFAMSLAVTLYSAVANLSEKVIVFVMDGGFARGTRDRILTTVRQGRSDVEVQFISPSMSQFANRIAGNPMSYLRLCLPALLPDDISHVLYLDSDLLVRADLAELWATRPLESPLAGVPDFASPTVSGRDALPNWRDLGLPADAPYVNAGVLLMNLNIWRAELLAEKILEYSAKHRAINRFWDQDGINAVLCQRTECVDLRWNVPIYLEFPPIIRGIEPNGILTTALSRKQALLWGPNILHFMGDRKPWRRGLGSQTQCEWLDWLWRSGWFASDPWTYRRLASSLWCDRLLRTSVRSMRALLGK